MDFKNCRFCKKSFRGFSALCPTCVEQLDQKYLIIRNYLDKNTGANITILAQDTGVDEKSILYLIREGRIALRGDSGGIQCMKCGVPILSGRYCEKCKGNLTRDLETTRSAMQSALQPEKPKADQQADQKNKMHILKDR